MDRNGFWDLVGVARNVDRVLWSVTRPNSMTDFKNSKNESVYAGGCRTNNSLVVRFCGLPLMLVCT